MLGCVIMASGVGKRFGSNKLLADFCDEPLISRTIASVPPELFDVVVSTRWAEVTVLAKRKRVCSVLHEGALRSESVRAGLSYGRERGWDGCLFLPGDQPCVSPASFSALAQTFVDGGCTHPVRLAHGGVPGSPVLFPAHMFGELMRLQDKSGGGALLKGRNDVRLVEAPELELADIDTVDDLERLSAAAKAVLPNCCPGRCV